VGQELIALERLQNEYLQGYVPNAHLYDGRRSLYDIARESFGGHIMLTEHFRCVPEIIQFSNRLCYQGRIRPLRESHSTPLKPPVVPYRVRGTRFGKVNEEEAETIAALILAMLQHPAYAEKTIGVISMVGEDQAKHIERLVRRLCLDDPKLEQELEKRKFLCGTSAQFQGDERDVVLLSLVDAPSPDGTPLPLRNDERFKQRFNVAASRARDQLWVVYSLDPANDLKEGDLRRELIQFALQVHSDPESVMQIPESERTESPFEREVLEYLVHRGYRVRAQWPVGSYRIDLVVEGETHRVAIECDGDRYHPIEKIPEDLERQAVLERLGWRFIRIRGSEFYRDRTSTMQRVEQELERMGIRPRGRFFSDTNLQSTPPSSLAEEIIREAKGMRERLAEHDRSNVIPLDALTPSHTPRVEPETTSAPMSPLPVFSTVTSSPLVVRIFRHGRR
jgi:very-short-patch-repair endonuclease